MRDIYAELKTKQLKQQLRQQRIELIGDTLTAVMIFALAFVWLYL